MKKPIWIVGVLAFLSPTWLLGQDPTELSVTSGINEFAEIRQIFESIIPGVVKSFDLPDLVAALVPREVWIVNGADPLGHPLAAREVKAQYIHVTEAFRRTGIEDALYIIDQKPDEKTSSLLADMLGK
ncbi:MAG TPA: hypothetical protein VE398_25880 [Acidobacteriota bacterium]|nr:hypothetical protein [Acidobacteriota bacterium]